MSDATAALPQFYAQPKSLQPEEHASLGLLPRTSFQFAAKAVSVPLTAFESPYAARHYPIVFSGGTDGLPLAILALRRDENLFVDGEGAWAPATHIPAYVRRYPFIFATHDDERLSLCVDLASDRLVEGGGEALFSAGKPTPFLDDALKFCSAFEHEMRETHAAMAAMARHDLFVRNHFNASLATGERIEMRDFLVVDPQRFDGLSDEAVLDLRGSGALPLIFAQFVARESWADLVRRLEARIGRPADR